MTSGRQAERPVLAGLLWPPEHAPRQGRHLDPRMVADLDLEPLVAALSGGDSRRAAFALDVLTDLETGTEVIAYRNQVLANLMEELELRARLEDATQAVTRLVDGRKFRMATAGWAVADLIDRLSELEQYVDAVEALHRALDGAPLRAPGLQALAASIQEIVESDEYRQLRHELPELRAHINPARSVTIGVNLSPNLLPESATILSVSDQPVQGRDSLIGRLLGRKQQGHGMTSLRRGTSAISFFPLLTAPTSTHDNTLVQDLRRFLEQLAKPIAEAVGRYLWAQAATFAPLEAEIHFLLQTARLASLLCQHDLPVCLPEIAPAGEDGSHLDACYSLTLALRTLKANGDTPRIVTNDVRFDRQTGQVWLLTGPNRGGKTTYTRAVGLAHLLFQSGLFVPAAKACISPIDAILTHFPAAESATPGEGRLDEEASRLAEIFREATPHSLILLNEVLSGTSTFESLALAHDAMRGLRALGARTIYVTHLHELGRHADEINASTPGSGVVGSLTAEIEEDGGLHRRTFRIRPGPPLGISYASEIARQHGISYEQIVSLLAEREVIEPGPPSES